MDFAQAGHDDRLRATSTSKQSHHHDRGVCLTSLEVDGTIAKVVVEEVQSYEWVVMPVEQCRDPDRWIRADWIPLDLLDVLRPARCDDVGGDGDATTTTTTSWVENASVIEAAAASDDVPVLVVDVAEQSSPTAARNAPHELDFRRQCVVFRRDWLDERVGPVRHDHRTPWLVTLAALRRTSVHPLASLQMVLRTLECFRV